MYRIAFLYGYVMVDTFGNMTTNIHDFMVDVILSGACHGYLVILVSSSVLFNMLK